MQCNPNQRSVSCGGCQLLQVPGHARLNEAEVAACPGDRRPQPFVESNHRFEADLLLEPVARQVLLRQALPALGVKKRSNRLGERKSRAALALRRSQTTLH